MKDDAAAPPRGALPQAETGADAAVPDRQFLRDHPVETAFLVNRFVVLHLLRVNEAFGGDITAAIVLGSLAHHNYRRFYFKKATGGYLWDKDPYRRRYLRGCLKAYLKSAFERRFYDLGRINFWGQKSEIDWGFDETKVHDRTQLPVLDEIQKVFTNDEFHPKRRSVNKRPTAREVRACGGPDEGGVATLESDGHEHEAVGGYIAQAIRASEVEEARLMGCPTEPDRHPEPPPAA